MECCSAAVLHASGNRMMECIQEKKIAMYVSHHLGWGSSIAAQLTNA